MNSSDGTPTTEGLSRLRAGSKALTQALLELEIDGRSERLHDKIRAIMPVLRSAMDWLEDTDHFDAAHQRLDSVGQLARQHFPSGCALAFRDGTYFQECPVALAHNRAGLSPGYIIRRAECSICGQDPSTCRHIKGRVYDGVRCVRRLVELDLLEVSFVGRPAQPDARIKSMSMSVTELRQQIGTDFELGARVTCDRCLKPCRGVHRPFEGGTRTERAGQ